MGGQVPWDTDFVRALPGLTQKYETVWCIDEVVTGFRDSPGGWQATVGVKPDLTTLGKSIGGGLGAGALVGRADIMNALKPVKPKNPAEKELRHRGPGMPTLSQQLRELPLASYIGEVRFRKRLINLRHTSQKKVTRF